MTDYRPPSETVGVNGEKAYGNEAEYADERGLSPMAPVDNQDGGRRLSLADKALSIRGKKENAWLAHTKRGRPLPSKARLWGMM